MLKRTPDTIALAGEGPPTTTLERELTLDGYRVQRVADHHEGLDTVDLVIITPGPVRADQGSLLHELRRGALPGIEPAARALWVAADEEQAGVLRAFDAGADDVLRCPWEYPELLARVRALLRRTTGSVSELAFGALRIDVAAREVTYGSQPLRLTRLEFELLLHLVRDPHHVRSRDELMRHVWGYRDTATTRTLDSHISRLRRALRDAGAEELLVNVRAVGYRLAPHHPELTGASR